MALDILSLCFQAAFPSFAQFDGKIVLSPDSFKNENNSIQLDNNWKYHAGDNVAWADPAFDDSDWEIVNTWVEPNKLAKGNWKGIGWFRLHLAVDSTLWKTPLALHVYQRGASEIYLDGVQIEQFGQVRTKESEVDVYMVKEVLFKDKTEHLIAVRYSNFSVDALYKSALNAGFNIILFGNPNYTVEHLVNRVRRRANEQMFFTGVPLAFAILHLLLFLFYPRSREILYYAVFTGLFAAAAFVDYQTDVNSNLVMIQRVLSIFVSVAGIRFAYSIFYRKLPKQFFFFVIS